MHLRGYAASTGLRKRKAQLGGVSHSGHGCWNFDRLSEVPKRSGCITISDKASTRERNWLSTLSSFSFNFFYRALQLDCIHSFAAPLSLPSTYLCILFFLLSLSQGTVLCTAFIMPFLGQNDSSMNYPEPSTRRHEFNARLNGHSAQFVNEHNQSLDSYSQLTHSQKW